ncbi:hypothetical protein ACH79_41055 [Bradyrhizobium sp. CCBAU 051011]|uniref:CobQ/CobB/MinD/ParA nucleotide binding domain-containing protein n=1 Tax=Bradyrhizobium lablabi TaxID=722472 RepID=A0A0R3NCM5_9BRAD|nr:MULTISPECIES: hypothetical protein [Bradyrhizobium]KRR28111.1 hypothetical protein CQ14_37205 [Bradyrhizobium lablabi]QHO78023.1 hypothetical protein ACH79_41055 [Bradyrhizobium sp. CCBAU 051011]
MTASLVISAPASGVGKTTLTLARAYRDRGLKVQCFKSEPDYIDARQLPIRNQRPYLYGEATHSRRSRQN